MEIKKLNIRCVVTLRSLFDGLRKKHKEGSTYWCDRYLSEISGFVDALWYTKTITEKQRDMIIDYAIVMSVYGHAIVKNNDNNAVGSGQIKDAIAIEASPTAPDKIDQNDIEKKVLAIVEKICDTKTNCRGISGNEDSIKALMELKGINIDDINVYEIPLNWNYQVSILYVVKSTGEYRELFAGIGTDKKFYFEDKRDDEYYIAVSHCS